MSSGVVKFYEQDALRIVTGDSIHPGGLQLTEHAIELCSLSNHARIMDVACGTGTSIQWLKGKKAVQGFGMDASIQMLQTGHQHNPGLPLVCGNGDSLPVASQQLDAILVECSLSLMADLSKVLKEFFRVLRPSGFLIASDLYLRNPQYSESPQHLPIEFCLKGAMSQTELYKTLNDHDFSIQVWEDHTASLKQLIGQLIMTHGSMQGFWCKSMPCEVDMFELQAAIARTKPGYYLLIAQKNY